MTRPSLSTGFRRPKDERLPWLDDVPRSSSSRRTPRVPGWIATVMLVVAGTSYWAGVRSIAPIENTTPGISASLPEARPGIADTLGTTAETPPHEAATPPPSEPMDRSSAPATAARLKTSASKVVVGKSRQQSFETGDRYPLWPSTKVEGAEGRLVRIGTFESVAAAHDGWKKVLAEYPGMARLSPIVVSGKSLRDGRTFYSLQLGTSSQAHSNVLCERSSGLAIKCSVIGPVISEAK